LWGNEVNNSWNYVGWVGAVLAFGFVVFCFRRPWVLPLALVGALGPLLSLGPSLKVNNQHEGERPNPITSEWYLMPEEDATVSLPTEWVFTNVPGVNLMRATHRWGAVTRMVVVVLSALALTGFARRDGKWRPAMAFAIAVVAVIEILPDIPHTLETNRENEQARIAFAEEVVQEFDEMTESRETLLFLPFGNAYLANVLVPAGEVRSYSVGGDKNVELAVAVQPDAVIALNRNRSVEAMKRAFEETTLDAIVLTRYRLRWDADTWPPEDGRRPYLDGLAPLLESDSVEVDYGTWHAVIRPTR
jgi:hypothetical protein